MNLAGRNSALCKIISMGLGASMRDQDERVAGQDVASCMDTLLSPPGGAGHRTAAIG